MAYSPDVDNGTFRRWEISFTHTPTDVRIGCQVLLGGTATEAQKDAVFQALLDKIATLANVTINISKKTTEYESTISVTP